MEPRASKKEKTISDTIMDKKLETNSSFNVK